jgi:DNA-binding GntR family transcriptional regulator
MTTAQADDWLSTLAKGRPDLERASTAERVADVLRSRVLEGDLAPGLRLSEEAIGGALGVSRNTLREAFRLLTHERLLIHEYSRGVFVRIPSDTDVTDLYVARRIVECGALRRWPAAPEPARQAVRDAVRCGLDGAEAGRWMDVGTANMRFHQAISGLAGSTRINQEVSRLLAELRLAFYVMGDPREFHQDYLPMNHEILELLERGDVASAEQLLLQYFDTAEEHLVTRLRERASGS